MTGVDPASAITFLTLSLNAGSDTKAHAKVRAELLAGDTQALLEEVASVAVGVIQTLAELVHVTPETVIQTIAESFARGEFFHA